MLDDYAEMLLEIVNAMAPAHITDAGDDTWRSIMPLGRTDKTIVRACNDTDRYKFEFYTRPVTAEFIRDKLNSWGGVWSNPVIEDINTYKKVKIPVASESFFTTERTRIEWCIRHSWSFRMGEQI